MSTLRPIRWAAVFAALTLLVGCGGGSSGGKEEEGDSGPRTEAGGGGDSGGSSDGSADSTVTPDSGSPDSSVDATVDTQVADSEMPDHSVEDSGVPDTEVADSGVVDSGASDTFVADTAVADTAGGDTAPPDSAPADTAAPDSGAADTNPADAATESGEPAETGADAASESGPLDGATESGASNEAGGAETGAPDATGTFTIGGTVTGLVSGGSLLLDDNGGDGTFLTANGSFTFPTALPNGATYAVTVGANPETPASETCTVTFGGGTVEGANVTNVRVACTVNGYTLGGSIYGLASGASVGLQNGASALSVLGNGSASQPFQFSALVPPGGSYDVTISAQPSGQICYIPNPTGTPNGNVSSVVVKCRTGLVAYYPFDEGSGTTILDVTGNGNNGLHNATYVAGATATSGTALQFNGSNGAKVVGNAAFTWGASNADYTVDYWVYITTPGPTWVSPFHKSDMGGGDCCSGYERSPAHFFGPPGGTYNQMYAVMATSGQPNHYGALSPAFAMGSWIHFAAVHSGGNQMIYMDGIQAAATDVLDSGTVGGQGVLYLGNDTFYAGLVGMMDEVRIYSRALSPAEIQADMQ